MRGPGISPLAHPAGHFLCPSLAPADPALHAEVGRVPPGLDGCLLDDRPRLVESRTRRYLGKPAIAQLASPPVGARRLSPEPHRDRALNRQRCQSRSGHPLVHTLEGDGRLGPQPPQQRDLLGHPVAAACEALAERLVLHGVPAQADAQPEAAAGQQVHLGRLLGDQGSLPLRQDDDAGHQFQGRQCGQVAEQHQRLVKGGADVVGAIPSLMHRRVGTQDVVVGQHVGEAEFRYPLGVAADSARIPADLRLRENHSYVHKILFYRTAGILGYRHLTSGLAVASQPMVYQDGLPHLGRWPARGRSGIQSPATRPTTAVRRASLLRVATHVASWLPFLAVVADSMRVKWRVVGDGAGIALHSWNALTAHGPLVGQTTELAHGLHDPGPLQYWLLAVPVHLDPVRGVLWGAALWCMVAGSLTIEATWSALGKIGGLLASGTILAMVAWRPELAIKPYWNPWFGMLFFLAALAACWAVMSGRRRWWPLLVITASVAAQ